MSKVPQWLNLTKNAPARLAMLRAAGNGDWRAIRASRGGTFVNAQMYYGNFGQGTQSDGSRIWSTFTGEKFRGETFASNCEDVPRSVRGSSGWYTDTDCRATARGIVAKLPHGRFIAGYYWSDNGERVYFGGTYTAEREAAIAADGHAESFAELAREDSEKFDAMQKCEIAIEDDLQRLRECVALRHKKCMTYIREEIGELIESIRANRTELATTFKDLR